MTSCDALIAKDLRAELKTKIIGREIVVLQETTSTNDSILERASTAPEGLVVLAEYQTAGRGQRTNLWESAAGKGLWFSVLLRPKIELEQSPHLAEWTARTLVAAISKEFTLPATIKLPNDVYVAGKKVGGVLIEMRAKKNARHIAIAGIGINVNHTLDDFSEELRPRVISLAMALNRKVDRREFAIALLRDLDRTYCELFGT